MSVLKIAGKDPNDNVRGVAVSADGRVLTDIGGVGNIATEKVWHVTETTLVNTVVPDGSAHAASETLDLGSAGMVSLRINNITKRDMTISFNCDVTNGAISISKGMLSLDGNSIVVPATKLFIVTPTDLPVLNYLHVLRLKYQASGAPIDVEDEAAKLVIVAVTKG